MKRSEASGNAIDRGIGIGRVGVEKPTFDFVRTIQGAQAKNYSGLENRSVYRSSVSGGTNMRTEYQRQNSNVSRVTLPFR